MRKNIIFLVFSLFIISACSNNARIITEKDAPRDLNQFDSSDITGRLNAIKSGLTPKVKPTGKAAQPQEEQQPPEGGEGKQVQLENLASKFDSATINTNLGKIKVKFYTGEAPLTVNNFLNLAKAGFYNGTTFHRIVKDFMIQGGDPLSKDNDPSNDGKGGPGYQFQDEINAHKLVKGSLAMANSGANTNGSQFFIVTASSTPWIEGKHTNFGYVEEGIEVVDAIGNSETGENERPIKDIIIESIEPANGSMKEEQGNFNPHAAATE